MWDVAARYSGEFNGFKLAVAGAYNEVSSKGCNEIQAGFDAPAAPETANLGTPGTGLGGYNNLAGAFGADGFEPTTSRLVPTSSTSRPGSGVMSPTGISTKTWLLVVSMQLLPEQDTWYFKAGLRERWHPLGHTVLYGEYETVSDAYQVESGDFRLWGLGVVQEIDAAAMSLWISYRNIEADDHSAAAQAAFGSSEANFQYVKGGALINF